MAFADVGETVIVPFDKTLQVDGFDNVLETKGKEATVIQVQVSDIDEEGTETLDYFIQFDETFDLLNSSGIVEFSIDSIWFTEEELTGKTTEVEPLPLTTSEINNLLRLNKATLKKSLTQGTSYLNKIPKTDPIFRSVAENIIEVMEGNNSFGQSVRYNPKDDTSVQGITADAEGTTLQSEDGDAFVTALNVLQTQQSVVASKTAELLKQEQQAQASFNKANQTEAKANNTFIELLASDEEVSMIGSSNISPVDWDTTEPDTPTASDVLPETLSPAKEAAQLFPLLDAGDVVKSGLV